MTDDLSPRPSGVLHQFSFVDALVAGLYEGAFRASDVLGAGDFGVGCGDALDGEIVLLDGVMHLCRGDGQVVDVAPDAKTFRPSAARKVHRPFRPRFRAKKRRARNVRDYRGEVAWAAHFRAQLTPSTAADMMPPA